MLRVGLGRITPINARTGGPTGGGTPSFLLDFADAGAGVVNVAPSAPMGVSATFTRATDATTVLSTGLIGTVASGSPRSYYDPTSLTYLGYLAEGARTNLLLQSADTTNASWSKTDTTPTLSGVGPDGGANTANLLTEGSAGTAIVSQAVTGTADATYSVSVWAKAGNTSWFRFSVANGANGFEGWFDVTNGALGLFQANGTGTATSRTITQYPNGWWRIVMVGAVGSGATAITVSTLSASASGGGRVNNSTRSMWGFQFENNVSFASSYIATVGTTVTRNADVLTYPLTGWFNATAGTFFTQYVPFIADSSGHPSFGVSDGTANEEMYVGNISTSRFVVIDGGASQANISGTNVTAGTSTKIAASYAANDFAIVKDGGAATTDTSGTLPTVTTANVGTGGAGQLFGVIRRNAYFPSILPTAQKQAMTTL